MYRSNDGTVCMFVCLFVGRCVCLLVMFVGYVCLFVGLFVGLFCECKNQEYTYTFALSSFMIQCHNEGYDPYSTPMPQTSQITMYFSLKLAFSFRSFRCLIGRIKNANLTARKH